MFQKVNFWISDNGNLLKSLLIIFVEIFKALYFYFCMEVVNYLNLTS
jgi:hypothetical protein